MIIHKRIFLVGSSSVYYKYNTMLVKLGSSIHQRNMHQDVGLSAVSALFYIFKSIRKDLLVHYLLKFDKFCHHTFSM